MQGKPTAAGPAPHPAPITLWERARSLRLVSVIVMALVAPFVADHRVVGSQTLVRVRGASHRLGRQRARDAATLAPDESSTRPPWLLGNAVCRILDDAEWVGEASVGVKCGPSPSSDRGRPLASPLAGVLVCLPCGAKEPPPEQGSHSYWARSSPSRDCRGRAATCRSRTRRPWPRTRGVLYRSRDHPRTAPRPRTCTRRDHGRWCSWVPSS